METFSNRRCTDTYFGLFWNFIVCLVDIWNNCWFIYRSNSTSTPKTHSHSRSSSHHHSRSSHHHHHRRSHRSRHSEDMVDSLALSNTEPKRPIPSSPISRRASGKSGGFRNWNPPMLGTLPDDFLRLTVPKSPDPLSLDGFLPLQNSSERTHHNISSRKNRHTERLSNSSSEQKKRSRGVAVSELRRDPSGPMEETTFQWCVLLMDKFRIYPQGCPSHWSAKLILRCMTSSLHVQIMHPFI